MDDPRGSTSMGQQPVVIEGVDHVQGFVRVTRSGPALLRVGDEALRNERHHLRGTSQAGTCGPKALYEAEEASAPPTMGSSSNTIFSALVPPA